MNLDDIDLSGVTNRNEKRVRRVLAEFLNSNKASAKVALLDAKDIQDIYALALNQLPARYAHSTTIIVGDPVRDEDARQAIMEAMETVLAFPKP